MQIIQQPSPQNNHTTKNTQITIDRNELTQKCTIIEELLQQQNETKHRQILERWPSENLSHRLQLSQQFQICRRKQNTRYYGEICNEMLHGFGILIYESKSESIRFFQGDFQNNCKHGHGMEYINGDIYIGKYVNNKPEDHSAVFFWKNGDTFTGTFVNGMKHGHGRWTSGQDLYVGEWKFNKPDGEGIIKTASSKYEGAVKNGYKHGTGAEIFVNGDRYNGEYANGKPQGQGTYYWNNGAVYKGEFKNGLRYGYGEWRFSSERYEGYYVNDKRNGHGLYTWQGGSFYKGQFQDDLRHGFGQMHWNEDSYYIGNWAEGAQDGEGELWQFGKLVKKGVFQNGRLVREISEQQTRGVIQKSLNPKPKQSLQPNVRYPPIPQKRSPAQKQKQQHLIQHRKSQGVKSAFSNQTAISKKTHSEVPSKLSEKHTYNRHHYQNSQTRGLHSPSHHGNSFQSNSGKNNHRQPSEKPNKGNLSYNHQQLRKVLHPAPRTMKSSAVDSFSQTHLSPIKWNNFKHMRGYEQQGNGKLPNIY